MEKKGNSPIVTFRAQQELIEALTEAAAQRGLCRSELIRKAIRLELREVQRESKQK